MQKRDKLNSDLKQAREEYYKNKFATLSNDSQNIWGAVGILIESPYCKFPSTLTFDGLECSGAPLAIQCNSHFLSAGPSLNPHSSEKDIDKYISYTVVNSIFLAPNTKQEVHSLL